MKRREFMSGMLLTAASFGLGAGCRRKIDSSLREKAISSAHVLQGTGRTMTEPLREIPVLA